MIISDDLIQIMELLHIDTSRAKVLFYLISHCNADDLTVSCTVDEIAREVGISKSSADRTMRILRDRGDIEMVYPGCWKIVGELADCFAGVTAEIDEDDDDNFVYIKHYID